MNLYLGHNIYSWGIQVLIPYLYIPRNSQMEHLLYQNLLFCFRTHHKHMLNSYFLHLQDFHVRHSYMNSRYYLIIFDHLHLFCSLFSDLIHYQVQIQLYHYPTTDMFLCRLHFLKFCSGSPYTHRLQIPLFYLYKFLAH